MNNKFITTILLITFIILFLLILFRTNNIENFEASSTSKWTTNKDELDAQSKPLNDVQQKQVTDMINSIGQSNLKTLISTQSPLLSGPQGPPGIQGPSGTQLIASGRLVNKDGSYNNKATNANYFNPEFVVTRTMGTNSSSSLSFMDNVSPFVPYQYWQLDINNNIKNRYDNNCLTMNNTQEKIYIDKCATDNVNQKWSWDNSNRIISTSASTAQNLKCIKLSKPEVNVLTTSIPNCTGDSCKNNTPKRYLTVDNCSVNNINDDEIWSFI